MDNNKVLDIYFENIREDGSRICKWTVLGKKYSIDHKVFPRINGIRKRATEKEFQLFVDCIRNCKKIMTSNGVSTYSIEHLAKLLRQGNKIVSEAPATNTSLHRKDRSVIYLLYSAGFYKLGVTLDTSVATRIKQLQTGNPYEISLIAQSPVLFNAYDVEKELYDMYKKNKVRGEWITLNPEELKHVKEMLS